MTSNRCDVGVIAKFILLSGIILLSSHNVQINCSEIREQDRSIDPETQMQIDDFIESVYLPASGISGLGLAIVQNDGELLYTTGYGFADEGKGIRNGNESQFMIASVTKSFTATLVCKLLHETFPELGEAVLDTPIRRLLPQVNFTLIDRFRSEHATFRDLLSHRLCLFRDDIQTDADSIETVAELVYRTRYTEAVCGMRGEPGYNNQMYVVAGELAAVLVNKPYQDAFQDLLNEIGMTGSAFVKKSDDFSRMPFRSQPYYVKDGQTHPFNPELVKRNSLNSAAGGLYSSPNDMAKFMRFQLSLGKIDGRQVVLQEVMQWLRKPSSILPEYEFKSSEDDRVYNLFGYGLGLMLASYDGWECIQHSGYVIPYTSLMSWFPGKNLGIFTSTNMGPELVDHMALHSFIFDALRGKGNATGMEMKMREMTPAEQDLTRTRSGGGFAAIYKEGSEGAISQNRVQLEIVGNYGSGGVGECDVSQKFNNETSQTEYYFAYGKWLTGWLREADNGAGAIYHLVYDTDIIQDEYAFGLNGNSTFVSFDGNGALTVFTELGDFTMLRAIFKLGVSLDTLPLIPWDQNSC